jgi:uncharacterized protein YkvS
MTKRGRLLNGLKEKERHEGVRGVLFFIMRVDASVLIYLIIMYDNFNDLHYNKKGL